MKKRTRVRQLRQLMRRGRVDMGVESLNPIRMVIDGARSLVDFIPGLKGHAVGAVVHGAGAGFEADDMEAALREAGFRRKDLENAKYSKAAREKLAALDGGHVTSTVIKYGFTGGASLLGGLAGSFFIPIPIVGGLVGGMASGYLAHRVYDGVCPKAEQDAVNMAAFCFHKQRHHQPVTREEAFALLMSNIREDKQKPHENKLERLLGTRNFQEASQNKAAMNKIMNSRNAQDDAAAWNHIPLNPHNPDQHVADQVAELLNSGALDARTFILNPEKIRAVFERYYAQQAMASGGRLTSGGVELPQQLPSSAHPRGQQQART